MTTRHALRIIDQGGDRVLAGSSLASLDESPFNRFIAAVTEHVRARAGSGDTELLFVFRPLLETRDVPFATDLGADGTCVPDACRLESPWIRLASQRSPSPFVRVQFTWNERQFLLDQALMSGARAWPHEPLVPIAERIFAQLADDYAQTVLLAASPEAAARAMADVSRRIPPDILWLFQHAWQSTRGPFVGFARAALGDTVRLAGPGYIELAKSLVDSCLTSVKTEQRYENILDLTNVVALDHYRINQLH